MNTGVCNNNNVFSLQKCNRKKYVPKITLNKSFRITKTFIQTFGGEN